MRTDQNVRGLVICDDKILLIHRFKDGNEYWVVPGGGVEEGEELEEALKREMIEETGLETLNCKLIASTDYEFPGKTHIYLCQMSEGEPVLGGPEKENEDENNQYILTWVPIEEAKRLEHVYPKTVIDFI